MDRLTNLIHTQINGYQDQFLYTKTLIKESPNLFEQIVIQPNVAVIQSMRSDLRDLGNLVGSIDPKTVANGAYVAFDTVTLLPTLWCRLTKLPQKRGAKLALQFLKIMDVYRRQLNNLYQITKVFRILQLVAVLQGHTSQIARIALIAGQAFLIAAGVLSLVTIFLNARKLYYSYQFQNAFNAANTGESINQQFDNISKFISLSSNDQLNKQFQVEGELLKLQLRMLEKSDDAEKKRIVDTLKGRIDSTIHNSQLAILTDFVNIVAVGLYASGVLFPLALAVGGVVTVMTVGGFAHNSITSYQFENEMGLIDRPEGSPFSASSNQKIGVRQRISDFAKWQIGYLPRISVKEDLATA